MMQKKRTTMKGIADELGVSVSVVSRALSGQAKKYRISKATEEAVLEAARRHNFSHNLLARGLRLKKTNTLGLMVPDISNPFFSDMARCIEMSARQIGYTILLCDTQEDEAIERESLNILQSRMIDGLIIAPVGKTCDHLIALNEEQFPVVLVDRHFPGSEVPYVSSDNYGGGLKGTRHLLENGHRRICFVQGQPDAQVNIDRLSGFVAALDEYGVPAKDRLIAGDGFSRESGYNATQAMLRRKRRPTALFLANNQIALGAIHAIQEESMRVPDDISLVSFDEHPYSPYLATPLTTIAQQEPELGRYAVEIVERRIKGEDPKTVLSMTVPVSLVERSSVRAVAGALA